MSSMNSLARLGMISVAVAAVILAGGAAVANQPAVRPEEPPRRSCCRWAMPTAI